MANPNPAHNPTDGLGSAVKVNLSGTGIVRADNGGTIVGYFGNEYKVSLSLAGTSSVVVTPSTVDSGNNAYSATAGSWVYRSYNDPQITEASIDSTQIAPVGTQTAKIASVGASGSATVTVTGLHVGQAIIEVEYPTFDNAEGSMTVGNLGGPSAGTTVPKDAIYATLIVTVGP